MVEKLDQNLRVWLADLANRWDLSIEEVAHEVGAFEARNRIENYPKVAAALATRPIDLQKFVTAVRQCWVLDTRYDSIQFSDFVKQENSACTIIHALIDDFPEEESQVSERISHFVAEAVKFDGYLTPKGTHEKAGAVLLASLILTSLYPNRFVDYRRNRWENLAKQFQYDAPPLRSMYGACLVWAGQFAKKITETKTYQLYWPESDSLWVVAGICWDVLSPEKPKADPIDIDEIACFPEGKEKRRLHLIRERNQTVVAKAKKLALQRDPMLRCEVCGFSFSQAYGELGSEFIEAHHKTPLAKLKPNSETKVEDLGMVCANCHRMLHRGKKVLTIEELRAIVKQAGS